jgi:hypothetical protein
METGYINIIREEGKAPSVEATLADNNLWLDKYQIARMFNCYPQKIEANLRSIFKNRLLYEADVTYMHRYTYKGIERQCLYYNMEVLIFLSYRIASFEAKIFRDFVNQSFREHLKKKDRPPVYHIVWVAPVSYNWLSTNQLLTARHSQCRAFLLLCPRHASRSRSVTRKASSRHDRRQEYSINHFVILSRTLAGYHSG